MNTPQAADNPRAQRHADPPSAADGVHLSIVVPAHNEEENVQPLVEEIKKTVIDAGLTAELIVVDDGSTDGTRDKLQSLADDYPWLVVLARDRAMGQSAAMHAGIQAARGTLVATLDADLQNDPADLLAMVDQLEQQHADMVQGDRSRNRRDSRARRLSSTVGRKTRSLLLGDTIRDTGCSTRVLRASFAKRLPLIFRGMHRFVPVYVKMLGGKIIEVPANHRPRAAGTTKYGVGVFSRGLVGFFDCLAVRWMIRRYRDPHATPIDLREAK